MVFQNYCSIANSGYTTTTLTILDAPWTAAHCRTRAKLRKLLRVDGISDAVPKLGAKHDQRTHWSPCVALCCLAFDSGVVI